MAALWARHAWREAWPQHSAGLLRRGRYVVAGLGASQGSLFQQHEHVGVFHCLSRAAALSSLSSQLSSSSSEGCHWGAARAGQCTWVQHAGAPLLFWWVPRLHVHLRDNGQRGASFHSHSPTRGRLSRSQLDHNPLGPAVRGHLAPMMSTFANRESIQAPVLVSTGAVAPTPSNHSLTHVRKGDER
jgi:hypothetical protein